MHDIVCLNILINILRFKEVAMQKKFVFHSQPMKSPVLTDNIHADSIQNHHTLKSVIILYMCRHYTVCFQEDNKNI
uniref:Uncharacterized protein n=1 Tax=Octopus bimaculoides TaxID=37653 RepID=A0A0L8HPA4_OCTBM